MRKEFSLNILDQIEKCPIFEIYKFIKIIISFLFQEHKIEIQNYQLHTNSKIASVDTNSD